MILALLTPCFAAPHVTLVDEPLHPGRATWIELVDDTATGPPREPVTRGGQARSWVNVRPGVWRAVFVPAVSADSVEVSVGAATVRRDLVPPAASALRVPQLLDTQVGTPAVDVPVGGFDGEPGDLQVDTSEGSATVEAVSGGYTVHFTPEALLYPRWVLLAIRDRRTATEPVFVRVRLRGRPRVPMMVDPGVSLQLEVGGRPYGPFQASSTGAIEGRVDQYPGETSALAILTDPLGNVTRTEIPLVAESEPTLVASVASELLPGRPPPMFHVASVLPTGVPTPEAPVCRASFGELPLRERTPGAWYASLPPLVEPEDVRVVCTSGTRQAAFRIPVAAVPARLSLRVWPEELRADFPTAEVRVALEDWRGERLPVDRIELSADEGQVDALGGDPALGRSEYDGATAVAGTRDTIRARYVPPPGTYAPHELELGWTIANPTGFTLSARVLDRLRRPLAGAVVGLRAGDVLAEAVTGPDGWARALVTPAITAGPTAISATVVGPAGRLARHGFVLQSEPASTTSAADLRADVELSLRPGRVAGLDLDIDPPVLRAGPGAVAWVVVRMEDSLGQPVLDEPVTVEVSEGTVGELRQRSDGSLVAEYQPLAVTERREVEITASTESMHSSARLSLEPRVVRYSLGPWVGAGTRFGPGVYPIGGVDLDVRLRNPLVGEALMVRLGVAVTSGSTTVATGVGPPAEVRSTLVPGSLALLLRNDGGAWSVWGGGGLALGVQHLDIRFAGRAVTRGETWVVGPELHAALARRTVAGEFALGLRGTWLQAPATDVGFDGNLGGVSATLAYRVVW